jgi:3'(2'), 5'-bisphosphate nucleotidase
LEISEIYHTAIKASIKASKVIMEYYENGFNSEIKSDGSPVTQADFASSKVILEELKNTKIPVVDEESIHLPFEIRKNWKQNWCIDPLDGTKEFIKKNGEFSVNIALIENKKSIFGLIASPVKQKIIFGGKNIGVYILNFDQIDNPSTWEKIKSSSIENNSLKIIASRSHNSDLSLSFKEKIRSNFGDFETISKGSALKFFDLARDEVSIYPRFAPTMEWDIAAGHAIIEELGGKIAHPETFHSLEYNKEDLTNPYFICYTQNVADKFEKKFFKNDNKRKANIHEI